MRKTINFLGIKLGALTRSEIVEEILDYAINGKAKFITYLNAHCLNTALMDNEYQKILHKADLVYAGGQGVVWAAGFLGVPLPERVNILDFFDMLVQQLKERKITIYLLGGTQSVVKKAEERLKDLGLIVAGSRDGFFNKAQEPEVIREINTLNPDILMVGMGVPLQEKWIYGHLNELNVKLCWGVGGVFKILSGELKRTPKWIGDCGLEWLYLGLQDPARLFKRYLTGNFIFIFHILRHRLKSLKVKRDSNVINK